MGWMEVLALLKRLGPALSRLLPMLETFVATRGGARGDAEAVDHISAEMKTGRAEAARNHAALTDLLAGQAKQVEALGAGLHHIREADERGAARLLEVEMQVTNLGKTIQQQKQLLVTVLVLCVLLLAAIVFLLFRR